MNPRFRCNRLWVCQLPDLLNIIQLPSLVEELFLRTVTIRDSIPSLKDRRKMMAHRHGETRITFCVRGVISPVLANIALDGLERCLREEDPRRGKGSEKGRYAGVHLIRYADDCAPRRRGGGFMN